MTKKEPKNACFKDESLKEGALNIQMLRLGCYLPIPIKISGYAPARSLHSAKFSPMAQNNNYATGW